jgi:hypothetical protein
MQYDRRSIYQVNAMPSDSELALTNLLYELRASRLIRKEGREEGLTLPSNAMRISNLVDASISRASSPAIGKPIDMP